MKIFKRLENIFSAIAFAEAGEHETARQILKESEQDREAERREAESKRAGKHEHIAPSRSRA
jgi:hypothetical protein